MSSYPPPLPPFQHQPYSNPPPPTSNTITPSIPIPGPPPRHHSHVGHPSHQPLDHYYYSSTPPSVGSTTPHYDPTLPPLPAGQVFAPQPQQPMAPYAPNPNNNNSLMPSAAAQMAVPDYYRRGSHESHHSHHSHRSGRHRSSSSQSHRSGHNSHHHHRDDRSRSRSRGLAKEDPRPTLGDTLLLMWDSVFGAFSRRRT